MNDENGTHVSGSSWTVVETMAIFLTNKAYEKQHKAMNRRNL